MALNAPAVPFGHDLLLDCYVSRDGQEIRQMPGFKCIIDPVTTARTPADAPGATTGYECDVVESYRPVNETVSNYLFAKEEAFTQQQVVWCDDNKPLFVEQVANRWVLVGESGVRREPIFNTGRTAYVRVTAVTHVSATQCDLTVNQQPETTANATNGIVAGNSLTVRGLTSGVAGTALNQKAHVVASFPTATTIRINTSIVDPANNLTGQSAFVDRITPDFDGTSSTIGDDEYSLTAWHVGRKGDPTGDPITEVAPAHVANRRRDYGDATTTVAEGDLGRSRRRQHPLPYRPNPHVADQRLILAAPGYGCVFHVPVLTPTHTGDGFDLDGHYPGNSVWDQPRCVGIPKALVWEDTETDAIVNETQLATVSTNTTLQVAGAPWTVDQWIGFRVYIVDGAAAGNSSVISANTTNTITFGAIAGLAGTNPNFVIYGDTWHVLSTAVAQESFGGSNAASGVPRAGIYGFRFAYRDDTTGEMGLPSDPIFVSTNAVTSALQKIRFRVLFPGYVMPECLALTICVYRTQKNGTSGSTFFFDRAIPLTSSHHGLDPATGLTSVELTMIYKEDAQLANSPVPVPDLNQMPMGCADSITAKSWTVYGGSLGNAGPDLSLIQTDIGIRYDAITVFDSLYPQLDTAFTHGSSATGSKSYYTGESGTASAVTTVTLTDAAKAWVTNQWVHWVVRITSGAASGQESEIISNTATQLTFAEIATLAGLPTYIIIARQPKFTGQLGIPSSYAQQSIFSSGLLPYPTRQARLIAMRNPQAAYLSATLAVPETQIRELRWRLDSDVFEKDKAHDHERRRVVYIRGLRGALQIAEQDRPDITPGTNTTIVDDDRDANIEALGTYQGQILAATRRRTHMLGFSVSPVGAPVDMVSDSFGCIAPNTMVEHDGGSAWISDRGPVALMGGFQWIGQSLEPWFVGESARFLRDSRGMMRHAWGHHDAQRGLVMFGVFENRLRGTDDEVTVTHQGVTYLWDDASDEVRSRFPCDTILVWSYAVNAWSIWRPQAGREWLWMASGQDATGTERSVFLCRDGRVYALDDQYSNFNRGGGFATVATRQTGSTITVTTTYGQAVSDIGASDSYAAPGMRVLIVRGSATESPFVVADTTLVSATGAALTLPVSVSVEPNDTVWVGARTMSIVTTFRNFKGTDISRVAPIGLRTTVQSLLTHATQSGADTFPTLAFAKASVQSTSYEHRVEQYSDLPVTEDGHANYTYLSQSRPGDLLVVDRALAQGSNSGQNLRFRIDIVSAGSVRVHDLYADVT